MSEDNAKHSLLVDWVLGPLLAIICGGLFYQALSFLFTTLWWLLNLRGVTLFGTILVLLLGAALFYFKKRHQKFYGLAEIGFALAVSWASITRVQSISDTTSWITVLAAGYLVVRGMSNYDEGRRLITR
ncbi:MAG TPA: hypothetical protein VGO56_09580 [Pyrinomonadaceae bacterium]|nr:hypothetical protein [Pyrinomonadaceae bacterium]